jgi:hypothetical protein
MAKSKKGLPEITCTKDTHPELVAAAKEALSLRAQIAELQVKEDTLKTKIANLAGFTRVAEETNKTNYVGLVKIVDENQATAQVQFKICNGGLAETEGPVLDGHFNSARTLLFEKDYAVQNILDSDALLAEMKARGQNPWDYVELHVRKDLDRAFKDSPNVTVDKAFLPFEGFLATLNEIKHTLTPDARAYISKYLEACLKASVSLGHK